MRKLLITMLILVSSGLIASRAHGGELPRGIFKLEGIEPSLEHDDLRPLGKLLGKAEVVGLGEAVHTTAGFSLPKLRLFRYLVEEEGLRAFGFESPWIDAERAR